MGQARGCMYPDDASQLGSRCSRATAGIQRAKSEKEVRDSSECLPQITADTNKAVARKRRDDEEKKRLAELDRQSFALSELKRSLDEISPADCAKFDPLGRKAAEQALAKVDVFLSKGDPQAVRAPLSSAQDSLEKHVSTVVQARAEWLRRKGEAESAVNELNSLMEGLKADEVVLRWRSASVQAMAKMLQEADQAVLAEEFDAPSAILKQANAEVDKIVAEANEAQLKADERDYIVTSMGNALRDLGFEVGPPQAEHPDHPASAIVFRALNTNKEGVAVSVPFEGEVMYDVGGYPLQTAQRVDGKGKAKICDKAQGMLEEIHTALAQRYGVNMGELSWEDKDPDRNVRAAEELPAGGDAAARGGLI
ncbi:MAG: hypothetical protein NT018_08830 [Armatimonadetes bacterium]|nr:hypothetical protein [Armatimonadota bacterium]